MDINQKIHLIFYNDRCCLAGYLVFSTLFFHQNMFIEEIQYLGGLVSIQGSQTRGIPITVGFFKHISGSISQAIMCLLISPVKLLTRFVSKLPYQFQDQTKTKFISIYSVQDNVLQMLIKFISLLFALDHKLFGFWRTV